MVLWTFRRFATPTTIIACAGRRTARQAIRLRTVVVGTRQFTARSLSGSRAASAVIYWEHLMNGVIYLVGLIVVVMAILSFVGIR
jgi:hypothetical protein